MILIAPDKFKGTYTAAEICSMAAGRLSAAGIDRPLRLAPVSDGGEGAAHAFMPQGKEIAKGVYRHGDTRLLVSSEIIGFDAFKDSGIPLMQRSSIALGRAVDHRFNTLIAVGGTAISDCGAGFLQGLGAKFYDAHDRLIAEPLCPATLSSVCRADLSEIKKYKLKGIVDVRASLTEGKLTALDFAQQKALPGEDLSALANAMSHFSKIIGGQSEWDGAGGGLGYALASVCGAECMSGAEAAVESLNVNWEDVELVITGEGCVDRQTANGGKLVDAIYRKAASLSIPTLILYGRREYSLPYPHLAQINSDWEETAKELLKI